MSEHLVHHCVFQFFAMFIIESNMNQIRDRVSCYVVSIEMFR